MEGLPKILDLGLHLFGGKLIKTRNPEAELQEPVYLVRTPNRLINCWIR